MKTRSYKTARNSHTQSGSQQVTTRQKRSTAGQKRKIDWGREDDGPSAGTRPRTQSISTTREPGLRTLTTDDIPELVKALFEAMPTSTSPPDGNSGPQRRSSGRQTSTYQPCDPEGEDHKSHDIASTMVDIVQIIPATQPYSKWLLQWNSHMSTATETAWVPPDATRITTPLISSHWGTLLAEHPDETLIKFFLTGIKLGFRIGFNHFPGTLRSAKKNLDCALHHPIVVDQYLSEELSCGRVAGPFNTTLIPNAHISRFGVIPKNH